MGVLVQILSNFNSHKLFLMSHSAASGQVVLMSIFRFRGWSRFWAMRQMAVLPPRLAKLDHLSFFKVLGTGAGLGYSSMPDFGKWALLTVWPSAELAREFFYHSAVMKDYREHSSEFFTLMLHPVRSKGRWSKAEPFLPMPALEGPYPFAILTRARLKMRFIIPFWRRVGGVSRSQKDYSGQIMSQGVGERPWLHQATFSIWENLEAMENFAYGKNSKHLEAIKITRQLKGFSEELYARFQVIGHQGSINGYNPLAQIKTPSLL